MKFDHIAIACTDLENGISFVEKALGVSLSPGGKHAYFGTHNALLGLGPDAYLEVIAIDPTVQHDGPRWFDLNQFEGAPRVHAWICSVPDMDAALQAYPMAGQAHDLQRGNLTWRFACPENGQLVDGGAFPHLIEWGAGAVHPTRILPDSGLRLTGLQVGHPQMQKMASRLPIPREQTPSIEYVIDNKPRLTARFAGAGRVLSL